MKKKFKFSHSVMGLLALLAAQGVLAAAFPIGLVAWVTIGCAVVGAIVTLYVATEIIEEVRNAEHMLLLLTALVVEFVVFFAFEYWYIVVVSPDSFPTLPADGVSYLLQSMMVLVFNPLFTPATVIGRTLLLINTAGALGLVLFILQNISQFRRMGLHLNQPNQFN